MSETTLRGYQGIFFDEHTSKQLVSLQSNQLDEPVKDMHVTFKFGEIEMYPKEVMNKNIEVKLVSYGCDGKNSGFEVVLPKEIEERFYKGNKPIHVTVSIGSINGVKGKPVNTANLNFKPLKKTITIKGKLGYFIFGDGGGKKTDNSVFK